MAGGKEIRTKISSTQNIQKITKAMEMVAASKMRKAQERMDMARPYAERIEVVASHISRALSGDNHPFLQERDKVNNIGLIVVSSDRGLCGGLNVNLFRHMLKTTEEWQKEGIGLKFGLIGSKAQAFFRHVGGDVIAQVDKLGDKPQLSQLVGLMTAMIEAYEKGEIDKLVIVENRFVNTMTQQPRVRQLLPIPPSEDDTMGHGEDYLYEPDSTSVLDFVLRRYIESLIYKAVTENVACEMAARMVAMKSSSDNAGDIIEKLQVAYNKARQAAITQEISEIVGGAAAV